MADERIDNPRGLPTGTVTLLFVDIEGSTDYLDRLGTAHYAQVLAKLRGTVRHAIAGHGGKEVDTQGDALFAAFQTAGEAVAAAAEVQAAVAAGDVRLRMGIHTGTPSLHEEGYIGRDVHRAARICGVAAGGQVALSQPAADQVGSSVTVKELGEFELRGFSRPERLYELVLVREGGAAPQERSR